MKIDYNSFLTKHIKTDNKSTDLELLQKISQLLLEVGDVKELEDNIYYLIQSLKNRANVIATLNDIRLRGWANTLCNITGLYHIANMRFLYETGKLVNDNIYDELLYLHKLGLEYTNKIYGDISSPEEWLSFINDEKYSIRKVLANGLNYLLRDYFIFSNKNREGDFIEFPLYQNNFDILVFLFVFSDIRTDRHEHKLFKEANHAYLTLLSFFDRELVWDIQIWDNRFPKDIKKLFLIFIKFATNLNKLKDLKRFQPLFLDCNHNYQRSELIYFIPLINNINYKLDILSIPNLNKNLVYIDKTNLIKLYHLLEHGRQIEDINLLDFQPLFSNMDCSDIFYLLNIYKYLPNLFTNNFLSAIKNKLIELHSANIHNVNYVVRLVQFNKVCELRCNLTEVNNLYNKIANDFLNCTKIDKKISVLFVLSNCPVTAPLFSAISILLAHKGVSFYNLEDNGFENGLVKPWEFSPRLTADSSNISGIIMDPYIALNEGWVVNLEKGILELDGINYYQGIYEITSRLYKVFHLNWSTPSVQLFFQSCFIKTDRILYALKQVREVAKKRKLSLKLISLQSQFNPWYAVKIFCEHNGDVFQHITIGSSYENWKNNMHNESLSTFTMLNNTKNREPSIPAFGTRSGFIYWYKNQYLLQKSKFDKLNYQLVSMKRSGIESSEVLPHYKKKLEIYKSQGKKIFCILGKIPYDMAVPYQGGPAHTDMSDWLNHTIKTIEGSNNILLVKPHPHELNYSISAKPVQGFLDLIHQRELHNTFLLPHKGINVQDLLHYVDIFLCWNGSAIAELGSQGVKVIACDDWAQKNYPIDVYMPLSRLDYEDILLGKKEVIMSPSFMQKSKAYTVYLTEAPFAIEYPFIHRSATNTKFHDINIVYEAFSKDNINLLMSKLDYVEDIFDLKT